MARTPQIDDLFTIRRPQEPAISPDGRQVVFTLSEADQDEDRQVTSLWVLPLDDADVGPRRLTSGPSDSSAVYSPDGRTIAFVRGQDGPGQIWVLPADGGEACQLTSMPWGASSPTWSPDGSQLAFQGAVHPEGAEPAAWASAPMATEDLGYQADGSGFIGGLRQRVHVVAVGAGSSPTESTVTTLGGPGLGHCTAPVWAQDGGSVLFSSASGAQPDLTMRTVPHRVQLASPHVAEELVATAWEFEVPIAVEPQTGRLLVMGSAVPGQGHTRLALRSPESGELDDLTGSLDRNVMTGAPGYPGAAPAFLGADLLVCVRDRGYTHLLRLGSDGGSVPLIDAERTVSGMSVDRAGGTAAVVLSSPSSFGELASIDLTTGEVTERTAYRDELLAELDWVRPRERVFRVGDGGEVHGWVIRREDAAGPGPLLLDIHGGPHNAWSGAADAEHLYHQVLAAAGWTVLILNPRASDGYGEKFYTATAGRWGVADLDDFLAPVDELVAEGVADQERLAVTGYSYGGFMTCYLTSRDSRFAAAVPGGMVADPASVSGTSDLGYFMAVRELGGVPWADAEGFAAQSPLARVDQVRTPTLVLHGAADLRCPVGEAQRWFTSLRAQEVPAELVLYPGASHLFILNGRPSHRADYNRRVVDFVHRHAGSAQRPGRAPIDPAHWERRLNALLDQHSVPGAALGILRLGTGIGGTDEVVTVSAGVLSRATSAPVSADSVFQIGSITKVWTATLVMQLVDSGELSLDDPVRSVLPELELADPAAASGVTVRHLLTHTSGIDGDIFTDCGRGDDVLEKYVAGLRSAQQIHPLGATFSYCNSGFNLLGRIVEKVTGEVFDAVLRSRLFTPLGLARAGTLPEEALLHDAAVGHVRGRDGQVRVVSQWGIPRSSGPAGLIHASAREVLDFAAVHLRGGVAADGTRVLSEESTRHMQAEQVVLPGRHDIGDSWGLGWIRFGWNGERLFGHDGNTIGQSAFLRILPGEDLAVVLLTNGGDTPDLFRSLYSEVFGSLADVSMPSPLSPRPAVPVELSEDIRGTYERRAERIEVSLVEDVPTLRSTSLEPLTDDEDPVRVYALHGFEESCYLLRPPGLDTWSPVTFYAIADGSRFVHHHLRATPKQPSSP